MTALRCPRLLCFGAAQRTWKGLYGVWHAVGHLLWVIGEPVGMAEPGTTSLVPPCEGQGCQFYSAF
jgi:hypothetical protein